MRYMPLTPEQIEQMREMKRQGHYGWEIAEKFGVSHGVVSKKTMGIPSTTKNHRRRENKGGWRKQLQTVKHLTPPNLEIGKRYQIRQHGNSWQKVDRAYEYLGIVPGQQVKWLFRSVAGRWKETFSLPQLADVKIREL